jgi:hypothetical protein
MSSIHFQNSGSLQFLSLSLLLYRYRFFSGLESFFNMEKITTFASKSKIYITQQTIFIRRRKMGNRKNRKCP